MIKRKQNTKTINDQKETEHKDYQWSKGNRTQRLSMIKRKQNTKTINDQKETEHKDYQWSEGNRTQRLSMIRWKQNKKTINDQHSTTEETKAWLTWTLLKTGMNTGGWHRRMYTSCSTSHALCVTLDTNEKIIREWEWNCEYDKQKLWFKYSITVNHSMISIVNQWERWLHFFQLCTGGWAPSLFGLLTWQLLNCSFKLILNKGQY
jgi:hypothetical protein